jgi:hypothetical protein
MKAREHFMEGKQPKVLMDFPYEQCRRWLKNRIVGDCFIGILSSGE